MIKFLVVVGFLAGFLQSILELFKDSDDGFGSKYLPNKKGILKVLPWIYILTFLSALLVFWSNEKEQESVKLLTEAMSNKIQTIDSTANQQLSAVNQTLSETDNIIKKVDSVRNISGDLLSRQTYLLEQYRKVNSKLSDQLEIEKSELVERRGIIDLKSYDLNWEPNFDSTAWGINACFENVGKRLLETDSVFGFVLLYDNKNKIIGGQLIPVNTVKKILSPNIMYCTRSNGFKVPFDYIQKQTDWAVIRLRVNYKDSLLNQKYTFTYYGAWSPKYGFGGPKDWQKGFADNWAIEHGLF